MTARKVGALIFRRERSHWIIDEFDERGRYAGSHGGNHSFPQLIGWREQIEWGEKIIPLDALALGIGQSVLGRRVQLQGPRIGLVRCIDGTAKARA